MFFMFSCFFLTLHCVLLCVRSIDSYLVSTGLLSPFYQISDRIKAFIAQVILRLAGVDLTIEYLKEYFPVPTE